MKYLRYALLTGGTLILIMGLGYAFQIKIATATWPWPDGPLSYLFIGSTLAAVSVDMLWIGWTQEWGALPAGSLNVLFIVTTTSSYFLILSANGRQGLNLYGSAGILAVMASAAAFLWSRKYPLGDERQTPMPVRISFGIFIAALVLAGGALVLRLPIFPWAVNPDSSMIFGCIFLGDACYFLYGLLKPRWHNALGQLLSFLAYDIFLIVPFLKLLGTVQPEHKLSLIVYLSILIYSGAISIYFLFIDKRTHNWSASIRKGKTFS